MWSLVRAHRYPIRLCPKVGAPSHAQYDPHMAFPADKQCRAATSLVTCGHTSRACIALNCTRNEVAVASREGCYQCCGGSIHHHSAPCVFPFDFR